MNEDLALLSLEHKYTRKINVNEVINQLTKERLIKQTFHCIFMAIVVINFIS